MRLSLAKSTFSRRWIVVFAILIVALVGFRGFSSSPAESGTPKAVPSRPIAIRATTPEIRDVPFYLTGVGRVDPFHEVAIRTQIDGELMRVYFSEGQQVKKGDLLVEIDSRSVKAELAQAQAEKARALAELATARVDSVRYQNLLKKDAIAKQTVDQSLALVKQLEASADAVQAMIDTNKVKLNFSKITSPVSGRVGIRRVDPGSIVRMSDAESIVTVTQMKPISIIFSLSQAHLPQLQQAMKGQKPLVEARANEGSALLASGVLETIDNQVDRTSGTIQLRARFKNDDQTLWPGQLISVRLKAGTYSDAMVIPIKAIQRGRDQTYVYRVKENKVEIAPITIAYEDRDDAVIESGLNASDSIVLDGHAKLRPGATVTIVTDQEVSSQEPVDTKVTHDRAP